MDSREEYKPYPERGWSNERVDRMIGNLLRIGLAASAVFVALGAAVFLLRHGDEIISYQVFHGEPPAYRSLPGILNEAFALHGRGLILTGLLLLIATPVARVAFSVVAFLRQRDIIYVIVTLIVLGILIFSLAGGGIR